MMKLGVKELIELCIYCWGHPLLYTFSGSVAVSVLLSGNLPQSTVVSAVIAHKYTEHSRSSTLSPAVFLVSPLWTPICY
jgi:hypothetical protein